MEKEDMKVENKKNTNIIIVILVVIICILMGIIGFIFGSGYGSTDNDTKNDGVVEKNDDEKDNDEIKALDLSKSLNTSELTYDGASDVEGDYGLSMNINSDKKSVTLVIDNSKFGPLYTTQWSPGVAEYQVTGFSKEISDVFIGDLGQSYVGITLFFLMSDGTVEYMPMFVQKFDQQGNSYYAMNAIFHDLGDVSDIHFETGGIVSGVNDVIKFYNVNVSNGTSGWRTTIGAKKDGSFYDLGTIIN